MLIRINFLRESREVVFLYSGFTPFKGFFTPNSPCFMPYPAGYARNPACMVQGCTGFTPFARIYTPNRSFFTRNLRQFTPKPGLFPPKGSFRAITTAIHAKLGPISATPGPTFTLNPSLVESNEGLFKLSGPLRRSHPLIISTGPIFAARSDHCFAVAANMNKNSDF